MDVFIVENNSVGSTGLAFIYLARTIESFQFCFQAASEVETTVSKKSTSVHQKCLFYIFLNYLIDILCYDKNLKNLIVHALWV